MSELDQIVLSWDIEIVSGSNQVSVEVNGSIELLTLTAGTYKGIQFSGTATNVGTDSLAQAFATMLTTHTEVSSCTAVYDFNTGLGTAHPATLYTVTPVTTILPGDEIDWSFSTMGGNIFGWPDGIAYQLSALTTTSQNSAGYWCPITGADNVFDLRDLEVIGSQSKAASANIEAAFSTRTISTVTNGTIIYDVVDDAFIRAYRAEDLLGAFVSNAKRTAGDLRNLLERLMIAGSANKTISFLRENTVLPYYIFKLSPPWNIGSVTTQVGNSGSRYTVTLRNSIVE